MEKVKKLMFVMLMSIVIGMSITSCSDDEKDPITPNINVVGIWECIESTESGNASEGCLSYGTFFYPGSGFVLLDSYYSDYEIKGFKCFLLSGMEDYEEYTVEYWDKITNAQQGIMFEPWDMYTMEGNVLSMMEADYDRYVGTVDIQGDIMTYTYTYQNWIANENPHIVDESDTYVAKFKKIG